MYSPNTFIINILKSELYEVFLELLKSNPDKKDIILKNIPIFEIQFNVNENNMCYNNENNLCLARCFDNGLEKQCSRKKVKGDLCTRHNKILLYGLITEDIPSKYINKFTKKKNETHKIINYNKENILLEIDIYKLYRDISNNQLNTIIINCRNYLIDNYTNFIYTNEDIPVFIGTYKNNYIIR